MMEAPQNLTSQKTVAIVSKPGRPELRELLPECRNGCARTIIRW